MRIVFVGAPGSGKEQIADDVWEQLMIRHNEGKGPVVLGPMGDAEEMRDALDLAYAVGPIVDYRMELTLATNRVFDQLALGDKEDLILTGTLIDNICHSLVYLANGVNTGVLSEGQVLRWELTGQLIYAMLVDSFKFDLLFYLPPKSEGALEGFYPDILSQLELTPVILDNRETNLEIVMSEYDRVAEANAASNDNGESEQKDA